MYLERGPNIVFSIEQGLGKISRGNYSFLSKYRGFGVYPMKKIEVWRKMLITKVNAAS